jgi:large subunit ribosomal protein L15
MVSMRQHELRPPKGAHKERRRLGRGHGSGRGKTAGRGTKGQKARSGGGVPPYFEGGQLPLVKRLPYKRGFFNPARTEYRPINLRSLAAFSGEVGPDELLAARMIDRDEPYKILAMGELSAALVVRAHKVSAAAQQKIEAAGGRVELLPPVDAKSRRAAVTEKRKAITMERRAQRAQRRAP